MKWQILLFFFSSDFFLTVPQKGPPSIEFAKNQLYYGDMLVANCTTSRARPAPHITWLINGKQVGFWISVVSLSDFDFCFDDAAGFILCDGITFKGGVH